MRLSGAGCSAVAKPITLVASAPSVVLQRNRYLAYDPEFSPNIRAYVLKLDKHQRNKPLLIATKEKAVQRIARLDKESSRTKQETIQIYQRRIPKRWIRF